MIARKFLGVFLSLSIALPSGATASTTGGTIKGTVSMEGRGLSGLALTVVNVETGRSYAVRSSARGSFSALVPAGSYVFLSPGRSGVSIARAPLSVDVASGKVASANIEVAALSAQDPAAVGGTTKITHNAANCITEGEFTLIEATFAPLASVVNGRLYFKSNLSPEWFYTEFERIEPSVQGGPTHRAFIPKVNKGGGIETIDYYIQVTSTDFAESKSPENQVKVVAGSKDCSGTLAPIGTPNGAVSVLSASGSAAGSLAGFGGIAGGALGIAGIAGIVGGALLGGVIVREVSNDDPTPTPTPTPTTSTPTPTPVPTATPVAQCLVSLVTSPNAPGGNWGPAGTIESPNTPGLQDGLVLFSSQPRYCTVTVTSNGVPVQGSPFSGTASFSVPCTAQVTFIATAAPPTSKIGPLPANWGGDCGGGSALGSPCQFSPISTPKSVSLTCATR